MAQAMNYSMLAGGKRLRPMLIRETYCLFDGKEEVVKPFMAGMEMIHTHSLFMTIFLHLMMMITGAAD